MFKSKTQDLTPRDPLVMAEDTSNPHTHPLFSHYLTEMKIAKHLEHEETILIGFESVGGSTEFAFTNLGLIWRTNKTKRNQVERLSYATNPITEVGFQEPGRKDRHAGLTFVMGNTGIAINLRRKGQEIPEAIKYFKILRMLSDEQARRQDQQAFAAELGGLHSAVTQICYKEALLGMMATLDMIPPPDEAVGRDGDPEHWDRVYVSRSAGPMIGFGALGMNGNKRPAW